MASNTENLNLLMKNPSTDGADTFNVQTMLNENWQKIDNNAGTVAQTLANILKPTTPPIIGLPPSTTPDGMFQALGNTGELHVWRKTEKVGSKGYYLDSVSSGRLSFVKNGAYVVTFSYSDTVSPNGALSGTVNMVSLSGTGDQTSKLSVLRGKFCRAESSGGSDSAFSGIIYIPNDATFTYKMEGLDYHSHYVDKKQTVVFTDAPTTTTYPVSTNPNAYQEGDDAKAAGYVLGEVVTGDFILGHANAEIGYIFYKASSPTVSDDGTIEVDKSHSILIFHTENWTASTLQAAIRGQFLQRGNYMDVASSFVPAGTIYIPNDAIVTQSNYTYTVSKYQPVTGYPAIPAGTTIEYLGKLGDKARVQVVSYVGTGTYGKDNPCSITADFLMKVVFYLGYLSGTSFRDPNYNNDTQTEVLVNMPTVYKSNRGFSKRNGTRYGKISPDRKTLYWYGTNSDDQLNTSGNTYYFLALA